MGQRAEPSGGQEPQAVLVREGAPPRSGFQSDAPKAGTVTAVVCIGTARLPGAFPVPHAQCMQWHRVGDTAASEVGSVGALQSPIGLTVVCGVWPGQCSGTSCGDQTRRF